MSVRPFAQRALFLALLLAALPGSGRAQAPDLFKGKSIIVYVSNPPGGGYDFFARLVARHIGRHVPGDPRVVVSNMPGAQGLTGANYLYTTAPKDGTALGVLTEEIAQDQVLGTPGIQYDAQRFNWIGRVTPMHGLIYVWHTVPVKKIEDMRERETIFASSNRAVTIYAHLLNVVTGARFKLVRGYPGTKDGYLAMERGEIEGVFTGLDVVKMMYSELLDKKMITVLVQQSLKRHSDFPDVPTSVELGKTPAEREVLAFFAKSGSLGRYLVAPPEVPTDIVAALRAAFDATMQDEQFIDEARRGRVPLDPAAGAELQKTASEILNIGAAERERVLEIAGASR
jgi:tripartite-type tricarboxylate transporter receptor subunit TctC